MPLGLDETSRVVRAHELMHARVSPHLREHYGALEDMSPRALECAEEFRINMLVARLGFDVSLLRDGSEKSSGRRLAEGDDWSEALCFMLAVLGTGAEKEYLAGVRQRQPTWMAGMRAVRKRVLGVVEPLAVASLGATRLNDDHLPSGYANVTVVLARLLTQSMVARPPLTPDALRAFRRSLEPGGRRPATGRFADLVFDESLEMSARARTGGLRRARPATSGSTMRYPSRLFTDDAKRAFAQRASVHGGVVLIDQSGSMDLDESALHALLQRAPRRARRGLQSPPGRRRRDAQRLDHGGSWCGRSDLSPRAMSATVWTGRCCAGASLGVGATSHSSGSPTDRSPTRTTTPMRTSPPSARPSCVNIEFDWSER